MRVFGKNKAETEETEIRETKKITPLQLFQNDELILEKIELLQQKIDGMDKNNKKFLMAANMNDGRAEQLEQGIVDMKLKIIGLLDQIDILLTAVFSSDANDLKKGLNSYYNQVVEIASGLGLEVINVAENMKFDSKIMECKEAVHLEDYEDDAVVSVLQRGYAEGILMQGGCHPEEEPEEQVFLHLCTDRHADLRKMRAGV